MTIEEVRRAKKEASLVILEIIAKLEKETGCDVCSIHITKDEGYGIITNIITDVDIKLEI